MLRYRFYEGNAKDLQNVVNQWLKEAEEHPAEEEEDEDDEHDNLPRISMETSHLLHKVEPSDLQGLTYTNLEVRSLNNGMHFAIMSFCDETSD